MTNSQYFKLLVWINGAVPGLVLAWDAWHGQLGANSVNDAIRTSGLLTLVMLSLSLCVTPLRRLTNWPQLIVVRRALGLWGFFYACIHLSLYVGLDRGMDLRSALEEIIKRRYLQVGIVAVLLMAPLAITSNDTMARRLGGKRWKQLHRLAYVVIALGVLHYYLLVKSDVRQPLAFAGAVGLLFGSRVAWRYHDHQRAPKASAALRAMPAAALASPAASGKVGIWKGELKVARIFVETPDVRTFRLVPIGGGTLPFDYQPGQFLTLEQEIDSRHVTRCYTIASSPSRTRYCEISVKREPLGTSSRHLHDHVREGDRLRIRAPGGKFTFAGSEAPRIVLIAGGVGITPLMSIARYLTDSCWAGKIDFILAARSREQLIFHDELQWLAARFPNLRVHIVLSNGADDPQWTGACGRLSQELLGQWIDDWDTPLIYVCGPKPMMATVSVLLAGLGVEPARVKTEAFVSPASRESADVMPTAAPVESDPPRPVEAMVHFSRSRQSSVLLPETTVLEAAEGIGLNLPYECRSGICGQCKIRLSSGRVTMDVEDALTPGDKNAGYILACQSHALEDLVVEA
jgi:ferredoxin-NADP reductase/DMSO/TMAO reductase YedYZ heme-binding membrane subunit